MFDGPVELRDPNSLVDSFAKTFCKFHSDSPSRAVFVTRDDTSHFGACSSVTVDKVCLTLGAISPRLTSGPDNIPCLLLAKCARVLSVPLCTIINCALRCGTFPVAWKRAKLTPVFKSGDPSSISNYRPIARLCNFSKVLEKIVYEILFCAFIPVADANQHGFLKGKSTVTNLIVFCQFLSESLSVVNQVDVVYTDFSKAFDRVGHAILCSKVNSLELPHSVKLLVQDYLTGRSHSVHYNGFNSFSFIPSSGVPQGSNLGPLLFAIFINDIGLKATYTC